MINGIVWEVTDMDYNAGFNPWELPCVTAKVCMKHDPYRLVYPSGGELMDDLRERLGTQPKQVPILGHSARPTLNIKKVIFNPPATIIIWNDNTKSVVKCQNGEEFDAEKGFALAYLKKLLGNKNEFNKEINKWVWED